MENSADRSRQELVVEAWKEINTNIRHWESILFDTAKNYGAVVSTAFGAAGFCAGLNRTKTVTEAAAAFLVFAATVSWAAVLTIQSQKRYLGRFYKRRRWLVMQQPILAVRLSGPSTDSKRMQVLSSPDIIEKVFKTSAALSMLLAVRTVAPIAVRTLVDVTEPMMRLMF